MNDLVVVSNRGPASFAIAADGSLEVRQAAGGLAPSLLHALAGTDSLWIAAAMTAGDRRAAAEGAAAGLKSGTELRLVEVPPELSDAAYRVIANGTLWFLAHGLFDLPHRPVFDRHWHEAWAGYRAFNRLFAEEVTRHAAPGATVVVNDYHLLLVGGFLAEMRPDLKSVHFTHTPFPSRRELGVLPSAVARELMTGLAAYGACGFHTARWADAYLACAAHHLDGAPAAFALPLGTDVAAIAEVAASPAALAARAALDERLAGRQMIFRADRVELSKNLVRGFLAFEELLEASPHLRERVVFVARVYPSREDVPEYPAYRATLEATVARINDRFGVGDNVPILLEVADDFPASVAALTRYDVLLVNPVRDGMNLVAREGPVVNGVDGVLALSREAGAFGELAPAALALEPFDVSGTAAVLGRALAMAPDERQRRAAELRRLAPGLSPTRWFAGILAEARPARPLPTR